MHWLHSYYRTILDRNGGNRRRRDSGRSSNGNDDADEPGQTPMRYMCLYNSVSIISCWPTYCSEVKKLTLRGRTPATTTKEDGAPVVIPGDAVAIPPASAGAEATALAMAINLEAAANNNNSETHVKSSSGLLLGFLHSL
jgi:hypothetical protein